MLQIVLSPSTILSNIMVEKDGQDADLVVPGGCLYHTVPIRFVHQLRTPSRRNVLMKK
jgi:hypothetical protein